MKNNYKLTDTISLKSVTLKKDDVIELCGIIEKATEGDPGAHVSLRLSGKDKSVEAESSTNLRNANWPREVEEGYFVARSYETDREIHIDFCNHPLFSFGSIEITAMSRDWVASRKEEIEEFIRDHRNYHWVFNNTWFLALQGLILWLLVAARLISLIMASMLQIIVIGGGVAFCLLYIWGAGKLFPFVFIDMERPSTVAGFRKIVKYAIPLIVLGLIIELVIRLV